MDRLIAPYTVPFGQHDVAPATGTPAMATSGNPAAQVPATIWPPYAWNMVSEEQRNVILAAKLEPSGADWTQLLQALQALFMGRGNSFVGQKESYYTPNPGDYTQVSLSFTTTAPSVVIVAGSINLGGGSQSVRASNAIYIDGSNAGLGADQCLGNMTNYGAATLAAGTHTVSSAYNYPTTENSGQTQAVGHSLLYANFPL